MDKENLIAAVFSRRPIWDQKDKNHHNYVVLRSCWKDIAKELNVAESTLKSQWKKLRETFYKKLSTQISIPGDKGSAFTKIDWPHFSSLSFLKEQFTAKTPEHIKEEEEAEMFTAQHTRTPKDEILLDEEASATEQRGSPNLNRFGCHFMTDEGDTSSASSSKRIRPSFSGGRGEKRDFLGEGLVRGEEEKVDYFRRKGESRIREGEIRTREDESRPMYEKDEDASFFDSILPHVRALSKKDKLKFRIEVLQLLAKMDDTPDHPTSASSTGRPSNYLHHR